MAKILEDNRRRRTCADRLRRDLKERQRVKGKNPAATVVLQLLGILSFGLSVLPRFSFPSSMFGSHLRRSAAEISTIDDDPGPTATMMERGYDPPLYPTAAAAPPRATASWHALVKDLQRRRTAAAARDLIEHRVPLAAVPWLRHHIQEEDWSALRMLAQPGASDDEISAAALREALRWEDAKPKPKQSKKRKALPASEDDGGLKI